jgi:Mce-associated membrane protein
VTADDQPQSAAGEEPPATGEEAIETSAEASDVGTTGPEPGARRRVGGWLRRHWVAVMAAAVLVSVAAAGSVYWTIYRPDRLTDTTAQEQVLDVARAGTEALLSYSPETVDTNVADAKSRLTGDFLQRYSEFADTVVVPAARERGVKTEANVARAAVSRMHTDSAQVLAFVNQVTTSKERPTPALATSSVMMTLVREDGRWLIAEFNPI